MACRRSFGRCFAGAGNISVTVSRPPVVLCAPSTQSPSHRKGCSPDGLPGCPPPPHTCPPARPQHHRHAPLVRLQRPRPALPRPHHRRTHPLPVHPPPPPRRSPPGNNRRRREPHATADRHRRRLRVRRQHAQPVRHRGCFRSAQLHARPAAPRVCAVDARRRRMGLLHPRL